MNGHRHAAAALYSLAQHDQEGILSELPESDQRILRDHIAELGSLGFFKVPPMAATFADPVPGLAAVASTADDPRHSLARAEARAVFAVLAHEPPVLIAQILALQQWPWARSVLEQMPASARKRVQAVLDAGVAVAPARARFLIASLSERLVPVPRPRRAWLPQAPAALKNWLVWIR